MKLRYGTRGSPLALAQSDQIAARIRAQAGVELERVVITTSGDRFAITAEKARDEGRAAPETGQGAPNVKAMFVKEIEEALLSGSIDFAVHSSKDLPGALPDGLVVAAFPEREDRRDAFIAGPGTPAFAALAPGTVVGTSALRRQIQLLAARPGLSFVPVRGNIDTRLKKLQRGDFAGIVLARAGLRRLGRGEVPHEVLPADVVVPAPGQGALALEARADRREVLAALASVEHARTRLEVELERAFLAAMGGGCSTPLGASAEAEGGVLRLSVFYAGLSGEKPFRKTVTCPADPARFAGTAGALAREILGR